MPSSYSKVWVTVHNHCRVPPFGNLRVTGCLHLSVAYRSLPRPSSADIAKASTVRPYYLYLFCVIICAYRRRLTLDFALRTTVRGSFISLRLLDMHQMLTKISWLNTWEIILTCIRYIVVFCSRTFSCTSPLSQRIISYVLGSTYLEILRDDLTNIYIIIFYAVFKEQICRYIPCYSSLHLSCSSSILPVCVDFAILRAPRLTRNLYAILILS